MNYRSTPYIKACWLRNSIEGVCLFHTIQHRRGVNHSRSRLLEIETLAENGIPPGASLAHTRRIFLFSS